MKLRFFVPHGFNPQYGAYMSHRNYRYQDEGILVKGDTTNLHAFINDCLYALTDGKSGYAPFNIYDAGSTGTAAHLQRALTVRMAEYATVASSEDDPFFLPTAYSYCSKRRNMLADSFKGVYLACSGKHGMTVYRDWEAVLQLARKAVRLPPQQGFYPAVWTQIIRHEHNRTSYQGWGWSKRSLGGYYRRQSQVKRMLQDAELLDSYAEDYPMLKGQAVKQRANWRKLDNMLFERPRHLCRSWKKQRKNHKQFKTIRSQTAYPNHNF